MLSLSPPNTPTSITATSFRAAARHTRFRCGNQGGGTAKAVFLQLRLMSCNLEQQEAMAAQNPRWQTEEEASNQQRSFPENKGSRGRLCSKRPSQSSYAAFPSCKFKQAQQVGGLYKKNGKWIVDLLGFPVVLST